MSDLTTPKFLVNKTILTSATKAAERNRNKTRSRKPQGKKRFPGIDLGSKNATHMGARPIKPLLPHSVSAERMKFLREIKRKAIRSWERIRSLTVGHFWHADYVDKSIEPYIRVHHSGWFCCTRQPSRRALGKLWDLTLHVPNTFCCRRVARLVARRFRYDPP